MYDNEQESMKNKHDGFTTVELLVTLFVAAAFLISGYQLYGLIINDSGEARAQARASNKASEYLQRYKESATDICSPQTPENNTAITVPGLSNATVSVAITCPYVSPNTISKITVTIKYNKPQQSVSSSTYVTK